MTDFTFTITKPNGTLITTVNISADDIADARKDYPVEWTDADIAVHLSEQRYESALNKAGYTFEEAVSQRLDFSDARSKA